MAVSDLFNVRKQVLNGDPRFTCYLLMLSFSSLFMGRIILILSTCRSISSASLSSCGKVYEYNFGSLLPSNRSFQVLAYDLPRPTFLPQIVYHLNDYLKFEVTYGTLQAILWLAYYYMLEPFAAVRSSLAVTHLTLSCYSSFTPPKQFCLS
jgi:hypothetical protein